MTRAGPLQWRTGDGWLVLIGGSTERWRATEMIDRRAIEAMSDEAPIAFVPAAGGPPDEGETFLQHYRRLGAPPGYVVPIHDRASADDQVSVRRLAQAGLIYFDGDDPKRLLEAMTGTRALDAVTAAYAAGAVIIGMSAGTEAFSAWSVSSSPDVGLLPGWGWLRQTLVAVHYDVVQADLLHAGLRAHPELLGLGLPVDTALALGPDGQVATWGRAQITVTLGVRFATAARDEK